MSLDIILEIDAVSPALKTDFRQDFVAGVTANIPYGIPIVWNLWKEVLSDRNYGHFLLSPYQTTHEGDIVMVDIMAKIFLGLHAILEDLIQESLSRFCFGRHHCSLLYLTDRIKNFAKCASTKISFASFHCFQLHFTDRIQDFRRFASTQIDIFSWPQLLSASLCILKRSLLVLIAHQISRAFCEDNIHEDDHYLRRPCGRYQHGHQSDAAQHKQRHNQSIPQTKSCHLPLIVNSHFDSTHTKRDKAHPRQHSNSPLVVHQIWSDDVVSLRVKKFRSSSLCLWLHPFIP